MLKKLMLSAAAASLVASPVLAAPQQAAAIRSAPQEIAPADEVVQGQGFWGASAPILIFLALVGVGVTIALLVNTDDEPASP